MKRNIIIIFAVALIAITARFIFAAYGQIMQGIMMKKTSTPTVSVGEVQEAQVVKQMDAPGRIISKYRVEVLARIEGYLIKSYFKEGDYVKKGQTLFQVEPQEWLYNVQKAKANINNAKAQLTYAEKQLKRAAILVEKDYIAKAEYDQMVSNRDALRSQLALYQANLRDAERNYSYTMIKAPVDGQVGMISVTVGNYVNPTVGTLTTIYSTNPIYVTFPIDSKGYLKLAKIDSSGTKRKVDLIFPTGEKYEYQGVQDFNDNKVDETTGTITLRATFPNPDRKLINGEYVKISIYSNNKINVPIVPQTAVLENPQGKYVYKLENGNIPVIAMIKTSGQYENNWIVDEGVKKGDKIITGGLQKVIPDQKVNIADEAALKSEDEKVKNKKKSGNFLRSALHLKKKV